MTHSLKPPVAQRIAHRLNAHNDERVDHYFWLNDRDNPDAMAYLEAENRYFDEVMADSQDLQGKLYEEMTGRIPKSDTSAPVRDGDWEYFYTQKEGEDYQAHYRRQSGTGNQGKLLLDENALAQGHQFFRLGSLQHSPCHRFVGYAVDTTGNEEYDLFILDIESGDLLPDTLRQVSSNFEWSHDSAKLYYTRLNAVHRPYQLCEHVIGTDSSKSDSIIFEEPDDAFYVYISTTCSRRYMSIDLHSNNTSEVHLFRSDEDQPSPRLIFPRKAEVEYEVEDYGDSLYVLTNDDALNFRLMKTSAQHPDSSTWETVIRHREDTTLNHIAVFKGHIAISARRQGVPEVQVLELESGTAYTVAHPDNVQELYIGANLEFDTEICRLRGNALNLPLSHYDFNMRTQCCDHVKTKPVRGGFDPNEYVTEQHFATSADGRKVPLYLMYAKSVDRTKPMPVVLNGYGSYGSSYPLYFSSGRLSLLDRGIGFAIAHLRGGGELGKGWYHDGKLKKKKNTFNDFDACASYLLDHRISAPDRLAISGGSAGGLVVGNFLNSRPQDCKAAIAHVPFVDIVTTILDDSLPLSVIERDEWGDPNDKATYDYMKSYSPYDNTKPAEYPAMFITAGLNDTRVGYWEPAKWAAKIRHLKRDSNVLVLKTEMHAGHGGKSGRYGALHDLSQEYAFIIVQLTGSGAGSDTGGKSNSG